MKPMHHMIRTLIADTRGSILIVGGFSIMTLTTLAAGATEFANFVNRKNMIENAADSALLAAATVSRSQDLNSVVTKFFNANIPDEYKDSIELGTITVTTNPETLEWSATIDAKIKTKLAKFIGFDNFSMKHKVSVAWDISKRLETVFLVDSSASMCTNTVRSEKEDGAFVLKYEPDYTCKKLTAMKRAMSYVIDNGLSSIQGLGGPAFYAGIIPFNHKVRLPNLDSAPEALIGSEKKLTAELTGLDKNKFSTGDANYFTDFTDAEPLSPVIPLKSLNSDADKQELKSLIDNINQSPVGRGWTRSNIAALTAALMLDPDNYAAFGGEKPNAFEPGKTDKIVIMMTDGANIGCCYAAHPEGNYDNQYLYLYEVDNAHMVGLENMPELARYQQKYNIPQKGLCSEMKEQGITIYSVVYDVDDRDPGGRAIKNVYQKCASSEQHYFDVGTEEELQLAYKTIAQSLLRLRITY